MWMMTHCEGHQGEEGTRKLTQVRQQKLKACQEQSCVRAFLMSSPGEKGFSYMLKLPKTMPTLDSGSFRKISASQIVLTTRERGYLGK